MRFNRKGNFKSWTPITSQLAHAAKARKRMSRSIEQIERPKSGLLLYTIRIESHLSKTGFEIKLFQGERLNQIIAETFGRKSHPHGLDWLMRKLRKKLIVRWLHNDT
jgi:hypothetical protein